VFINLILINRLAKEPLSPIEKIILKRRLNKIKANYYILSGYWFLLRNGLKMMDWGYICIIIGIFLAITQFYIAYQLPELDIAYSWLIFRTHHYIEMPGALLLGIGLSRIYQQKISDIIVWVIYIIVIICQVITKPYPTIAIISAAAI